MNNAFASALIACYRLHKLHQSIGSRQLYDAVNDAFVYDALVRHGSVVSGLTVILGEQGLPS
jgi:hypothetical protein